MENIIELNKEKSGYWEFPEPQPMCMEDAKLVNDCILSWYNNEEWNNKGFREKYPELESFLYVILVCEDLVYKDVEDLASRLREMRSAELALSETDDIPVVACSLKEILITLRYDPIRFRKLFLELNNGIK